MPTLPSFFTSSSSETTKTPKTLLERLRFELQAIPPETQALILGGFALGAASSTAAGWSYKRFFKRIKNSEWVTPRYLERKRWIKGVVTSVGDADNFRLYHTPGFGWRWPLKFRLIPTTSKDLKDQTLHIRMCGVDAPEAAHFGRPAQPFSEEALAWLKDKIENKTVYCQLIRKDQYGRIVSVPHLSPRLPILRSLRTGPCLSLLMLQAGWVEVYEQSGAEYGKWGKDHFLQVQEEAQRAKRGIWGSSPARGFPAVTGGSVSNEQPVRESAADYKRRHAALEQEKTAAATAAADKEKMKERARREKEDVMKNEGSGGIGRLWGWMTGNRK